MARYDISITTTDLDDRGLAHEVASTASLNVQTLLENRLREFIGGAVSGYLQTFQGRVGSALKADSSKIDAVAQAAGVDLGAAR